MDHARDDAGQFTELFPLREESFHFQKSSVEQRQLFDL
jgi:hypothetical protein